MRKTLLIFLIASYCIQLKSQLSLSDFVSSDKFTQKTFGDVYPDPGGEYFFLLKNNFVLRYSFANGELVDTLINTLGISFSVFPDIEKLTFNNTGKIFLLATNLKTLYRYSYYAKYYVYNSISGMLIAIADTQMIRGACLSPDGSKVAYVLQNNIYLQNLTDGNTEQITKDGELNKIINGTTDWVNEEEFSLKNGLFWSPDNKYLAFYQFDESLVKEYPLTNYNTKTYPEIFSYKYPRPGEPISKTKIFVLDINTGKVVQMKTQVENDHYLPRIVWSKIPGKLAIVRLNRPQNKLEMLMVSAEDGSSTLFYSETAKKYIDEPDEKILTFIDEKNDYILLSEQSGFKHLYYCTFDGLVKKQLTSGNWEVKEFLGYNSKSNTFYYTANTNSPVLEDIFSFSLKSNSIKQLVISGGTNKPAFSFDFKYFINSNSSFSKPVTETLYTHTGKLIKELIDNRELQKAVSDNNIPSKEAFFFYTEDSIKLYGWMLKPSGFDADKKYPVLFYIYGGPGVQLVEDKFSIRWYTYLATQGYVVVSVDNRGTGGRGVDFEGVTYRNFGDIEVLDQVAAVRYLSKLGFIDTSRVGVLGWSFGGYVSAMCLLKSNNVFKLAVSVAPVTDWRMYDATYTERYMGSFDDNVLGYLRSSLVENAEMLKGKLLLIHGTADENVQVQNSFAFSEALVQSNKQFEMQIYSDKNHRISGDNTSLHLYTKICEFILKNL